MKTVAMVLFPDFLLLDMAGPMEVFSIANRYLKPADHYVLTTIGTEPGALRASNGVKVQADQPIDQACDGFDLLLVPGGPVPTTKNIRPCSTGSSTTSVDPEPMARSAPGRLCWAMPVCSTAFA
jgi:transcriptional regulator GlxA family with amidase domain